MIYIIPIVIVSAILITLITASMFRVVVSTNEVHIIQKKKSSISYGRGQEAGNIYYNFPSWLPIIGISRIILPVSNFDITLDSYEAFDKDKVPFRVDVVGFFRIANPVEAAEKIESFEHLKIQLEQIINGAIRTVLSGKTIIEIMEARATISDMFNKEVQPQLVHWWVENVRSAEIMDITDSQNSKVIQMIKDKKSSAIEKDSRVEIADNLKLAKIAEIEAQKEADMKVQNAQREVGEKQAEKEKLVGIAQQISQQEVAAQTKTTREKEMEVRKVEQVKQAEIDKEQALIDAEREKQMKVIAADALKLEQEKKAEADLITKTRNAEGNLIEMTKNAQGIKAEGTSKAEAEKLMQVALVAGAIELADKIASTPEYMKYLQNIEAIKASQVVGTANAEALKDADLKILANSGAVDTWVTKLLDVFSSKGGAAMASMLENLNNSDIGKGLIGKILGKKNEVEKASEDKTDK